MTPKTWLQNLSSIPRVLLGALLVVSGTLIVAAPAHAAPTVTYPNAISNIQLEKEGDGGALVQWDMVRITAEWSVPDGARSGETFGMKLPDEFARWGTGAFDILAEDTDELMATCTVSQGDGPEVVCALTDVVEGIVNAGGSFWMRAEVTGFTAEDSVEFEVGDDIVFVGLPGEGGIGAEDLTEPEDPYKYGSESDEDGRFVWTVAIPSSYVRDGGFEIFDRLNPAHEYHSYVGTIRLLQRPVEDGQLVGSWTVVSPDKYDVAWAADMKSFRFIASGLGNGRIAYELQYETRADDMALVGDVFGNTATVGSTTTSAEYRVESHGGGTGSGDQYTRFTITKELHGEASGLAAHAEFTVQYSVAGSNELPKTLTFAPGEVARSDRAPLGSTFLVEEINLPVIGGVSWGEWTLAGDGVAPSEDGTSYSVTPRSASGVHLILTNDAQATPEPLGSLGWTKVDPDGELLAGSEWELIGPHGSVLIVVDNGPGDVDPADGVLLVEGLGYGEYVLTETRAPSGYQLLENSLRVTISADNLAASLGPVENLPVAPPVENDAGQSDSTAAGGLAQTGASGNTLEIVIGVILVALGAMSLVARRRAVMVRKS